MAYESPLEAHGLAQNGDIEHYAVISQAISLKRIADKMDLLVSLVEMVVSDLALSVAKQRFEK